MISANSSVATSTSIPAVTSAESATTTVSLALSETTETSFTSGFMTTENESTTVAISSQTTESLIASTTTLEAELIVTNFHIIADGGEADDITMGQVDNYFRLQFSSDSAWIPAALTLEKDTSYLRRVDPFRPNFPLVCVRWATGLVPNPGWFVDCNASDSVGNMVHPIKCELKAGGELSCSIGAGHCRHYLIPPRDNDGFDCQPDDGEFHNLYTEKGADYNGVTFYGPWMGSEGFGGQQNLFGNVLEPVTFRWISVD
ncbi:hypothetical protein F53441_13024 [Fusarium austroafricanum]|uniref:Uncharacterized protein n=1 Tax=Fusarium austroafricanum TaxID=2364996 RepID=A0A8H4JTS8_9HYPO|nr:hypothetical protein F53441_13024 [Fusarium austroafricanum]